MENKLMEFILFPYLQMGIKCKTQKTTMYWILSCWDFYYYIVFWWVSARRGYAEMHGRRGCKSQRCGKLECFDVDRATHTPSNKCASSILPRCIVSRLPSSLVATKEY